MVAKTKHAISSREADGRKVMAALRARITRFERRYEVSSEEMLNMIESGQMRDTAEVLKWAQDFHALRLYQQATHTGGRTIDDTK